MGKRVLSLLAVLTLISAAWAAQGHQKADERRDLLISGMSQPDIERASLWSVALAGVQPGLAPKVEQPASQRITRDELGRLIHDFVRKYQAGDLVQFMSLFAENAQGNESRDRGQVRKDYEDLFQTTDERRIRLVDVNWGRVSGGVQVWGRFDVTLRKNGEREVKTYIGKFKFHVEKQGPQLVITRFYHSQSKV
jgi:hypothetical protein